MANRSRNTSRPDEPRQDEQFVQGREVEERFDDKFDDILLHVGTLNAAAKALKKNGAKVAEKKKKIERGRQSKKIDIYKDKYKQNKNNLKESFCHLEKILGMSGSNQELPVFSRGDMKYRSAGHQRKQRNCSECERKDGIIQQLSGDLDTRKRKSSERDSRDVPAKTRNFGGSYEQDGHMGGREQLHEQSNQLQKENERLQEEIEKLKADNNNFQKQIEQLQTALDREKTAKADAQGRIQTKDQEISRLQVKMQSEATEKDTFNRKFQEKCQEAKQIHEMLASEKNAKENAIATVNSQHQEIRRLETSEAAERAAKDDALKRVTLQNQDIQRLEKSVAAERAAKDDALRRLSAMVSSRLRDNNPNITDLSDQNRPTKLAEKMSELYDNEWTDAFDELETNASKTDFIKCLLDTLMDIFNECKMWSLDNFFEKVLCTIGRSYPAEELMYGNTDVDDVFSKELKQQIKEIKKTQGRKVLPSIEKMVYERIPRLGQEPYTLSSMKVYIKKCIEISWLAVVQDPPLALNVGNSDQFDTKLFKEYLKRGPYVEFVVWPALHIEEGGALLCKGVAQGCMKQKQHMPTTSQDD